LDVAFWKKGGTTSVLIYGGGRDVFMYRHAMRAPDEMRQLCEQIVKIEFGGRQ